MLTFVHLSDIHFRNRDHLTEFDLDQGIRRALLDDIASKPAHGADYDGILITGDIAFSGDPKEYAIASQFLNEVYERTGDLATKTMMVPGNHDVNRRFVEPDLPLWAAHEKIRASTDITVWNDHIYKQLVRDPSRSIMSPLANYNNFAQGFDCFTGMIPGPSGEPEIPRLAWRRVFEKPLDDSTYVRFNGLNSALISDGGDAPGKLLVSEYQTSKFEHSNNMVDVVLCHHPPEWLMDKQDLRNKLRTFVPLSLFGHEHTAREDANAKEVHLFAGAVQPSRRDPGDWKPTYHIIQLAIEHDGLKRTLLIRVFTREYTKIAPIRFKASRTAEEEIFSEHRLALPDSALAPEPAISGSTTVPAEIELEAHMPPHSNESSPPTSNEIATRQLLVNFFRLPTPERYEAASQAGLLRDGDDALDPQVMWAEIFKRAASESKLEAFWAAVAEHSSTLNQTQNPFTPHG